MTIPHYPRHLSLREWREQNGERPMEVRGRGLAIADALGVPIELLDLGPDRRGVAHAGYRFVLVTRGSDERGWEAAVEAWQPPSTGPWCSAVARRANSGARTWGCTARDSLDALEAELRHLICTHLPDLGFSHEWDGAGTAAR